MSIGISDLKHVLKIHALWDTAHIKQFSLIDGTSFEDAVQELGTAITLFNQSLTAGYWSQFLSVTDEMTVEYDVGGGGLLPVMSEHSKPDSIKGARSGHMLPFKDYGGALEWTYLALKRMNMNAMRRDIRRLIERSRNRFDYEILTRAFGSTATVVGAGAGRSVPWADGNTADATFIPPAYQGRTFANTHNHFLRHTDDAAGRLAAAKAMAEHLLEHGIMGPWELVIGGSDAEKAAWVAVTGFTRPSREALITAGVERRAAIEDEYIGVLEVDQGWFRVRPENRLPTKYAGAFKATGFGSPDSPLIIRVEPNASLEMTMLADGGGQLPLQGAYNHFPFGVGVNSRLAGTATFFDAGGAYVDPVISI